ncbi:STAS domain-containing protein [Sporosarcina sp. Sa2YVA2]|uniref:STAS domain-containing protein n=1 Tax=Sporosarcina quadrami TaxID=2762234 RepID=A0ABR8UA47_9BACL|nr:STAS domain-containing protein [Sporosarcina quadrami]MBD7984917.1 STAS domain-containing protein [Sporosarcina quadrami]
MSFPNASLPLPVYAINKDLEILQLNQAAINSFTTGTSLFDIIDSESHPKLRNNVQPFKTIEALEINALSPTSEILLVDLYISWTEEKTAEVVFVKKDQSYINVSSQLNRLSNRLAETNFELLEAKETAETLLQENIILSSPFIEITENLALIPIFGELNVEKSATIATTITKRAYNSNVETIIIDFTAVRHIEQCGLTGLEKLVSMLQLLGFTIIVSGLHPTHVKEWIKLDFSKDIKFVKSLKSAV